MEDAESVPRFERGDDVERIELHSAPRRGQPGQLRVELVRDLLAQGRGQLLEPLLQRDRLEGPCADGVADRCDRLEQLAALRHERGDALVQRVGP